MVLPLAVGLLGPDGKDLELTMGGVALGTTTVLKMDQAAQTFVFQGVAEAPVPSLLRNLSAPVKLKANQSTADLVFLLANDSDEFNRWEVPWAHL
jgi:aminopeptidase N